MALRPETAMAPNPRLRARLRGVRTEFVRRPIYIGRTPDGEPIYVLMPQDPSFLVKMLVVGPSHSGKTIFVRNVVEGLFLETKYCMIPHCIIEIDWKGNYLGIWMPNKRPGDLQLLHDIHGVEETWGIPRRYVNVYVPAYMFPTAKAAKEWLSSEGRKFGVRGVWRIPWRRIMDLHFLAMIFKLPTETLWVQELMHTFNKARLDPDVGLTDVVGEDGLLERRAMQIAHSRSKEAALSFVRRWRENKVYFGEEDVLARHVEDEFSLNVLCLRWCQAMTYYNQLAFLVLLESLMDHMVRTRRMTQPIIVIHDILQYIGERKPFRGEILETLLRLMAGQARTLRHGYMVILESRSWDDLPKELRNKHDYTFAVRMKWQSSSPSLKHVGGFLGGVCSISDYYRDFYRRTVIVRPPRTAYVT